MKPTQTIAKFAPKLNMGLFATLCGLFHVKGTRAPKIVKGTGASKAGRRLILSVFATTLGALAFTTTPALAAGGHVFKESFNGGVGHEFSDPTGIAVNNVTGDVYVLDKGNNRVEEFNPTGTTVVAEFDGNGTAGKLSESGSIAIDNSGETASEDPSVGDVYVTDGNVVDKFSSTGAYLGQITGTEKCENGAEPLPCSGPGGKVVPVPFGTLEGVAVDPKGVVWVSQASTQIDAFSDAEPNVFLSSRDATQLEGGELKPGLAVDSEDRLYVPFEEAGFIAQLNSMGESEYASGGERNRGRTGVAVEPVSNDVYVDKGNPEEGAPKIEVYPPGGVGDGKFPIETFGEAQLSEGGDTGLAVSYAPVSSGDVYVLDSAAGKVDIFTPPKATAYAESFHFGGTGKGSGEFSEPLGVAVNDSTNSVTDPQGEDVYVVDKGNKRVEQFSKAGAFIRDFASPPGGFNEPESIAVDNCKNAMGEPCSTEEDPSVGDVYVTDQLPAVEEGKNGNGTPHLVSAAAVYKFEADGTYLGQLRQCPEDERKNGPCVPVGHPTAGFDRLLTGVGVGPEGTVWVGTGNGFGESYDEFSDTEPPTLLGASESPTSWGSAGPAIVTGSSALDPSTGALFVDKGSSIDWYASEEKSSSNLLDSFPSTPLQESKGIAVDPAGTVYASERAAGDVKAFNEHVLAQVAVGAVAGLRPTSVTLQGSVNPEGAKLSSCEFEYGTTTSYGQIAACEPAAGSLGEGTEPKLVGAKLSGLASGTTYHYRLVASDHAGTNRGSDHEVKTPGPSVTEEQVTYVEATTATLQAQIDPDGSPTSYHFEYDTSPYTSAAAHGTSVPVPNTLIGSGTGAVPVSVPVTGLQPGKVYYYRVVAEGEPLGAPEAFYGLGQTFETNPGPAPSQNCRNAKAREEQPFGLTLPDCRAYEIVSPLNTEGQDALTVQAAYGLRASLSGEAIAYVSAGAFGEASGAALRNEFLSRRGGAGWSTQGITPLQEPLFTQLVKPYEASVFTPELTAGVADATAPLAGTDAPQTPANTQTTSKLYVANFAEHSTEQSYAYVGQLGIGEAIGSPMGASSDLSHVVFDEGGAPSVVEWVNGRTFPVGVANDGEALSASVGSQAPDNGGLAEVDAWHAVSADGSRVYFTSPASEHENGVDEPPTPGQLYVRVNAERPQSKVTGTGTGEHCIEPEKACTVEVSASRRAIPDAHGLQGARYWGASTGLEKASESGPEKVFFTSNAELTDDAYTGPADNAANLYEYNLGTGTLTDLTGEKADNTGEGAAVQGVVQISEDGSYVYFVANGVLTSKANANDETAKPGTCTPHGTSGECNLYVSHEGGEPVFIATLAAGDESDWSNRSDGGPAVHTAVVDSSGARLAFISERSLTGYDNRQAAAGECEQHESSVAGFAEAGRCREVYLYDAEGHGLVCASCNATGARPVGPSNLGLPALALASYRPRNFSRDGTLFFDSSDALAPHAGDGRQNVYEYEDGHVYPLSNVAGGYESTFLDAGANGNNVFFASSEQLLPEDKNQNLVVWDARVDGGFPLATAAPSCDNGDSCKPPASPQPTIFGAGPSETFAGPGNPAPPPPAVVKKVVKKTAAQLKAEKLAKALKVCRKDKKKSKRQKCERQAKAKYGTGKNAKKASHNGRTH